MERYGSSLGQEPFEPPWEFVLDEITGLNMIGDRGRFSPAIVREKYLKWWQQASKQGRT